MAAVVWLICVGSCHKCRSGTRECSRKEEDVCPESMWGLEFIPRGRRFDRNGLNATVCWCEPMWPSSSFDSAGLRRLMVSECIHFFWANRLFEMCVSFIEIQRSPSWNWGERERSSPGREMNNRPPAGALSQRRQDSSLILLTVTDNQTF